jgi:hypothetical protein
MFQTIVPVPNKTSIDGGKFLDFVKSLEKGGMDRSETFTDTDESTVQHTVELLKAAGRAAGDRTIRTKVSQVNESTFAVTVWATDKPGRKVDNGQGSAPVKVAASKK